MPSVPRIDEFYIHGSGTQDTHVLLHITEPKTTRKESGGHFFALAQITDSSLEEISYIQGLISEIEDEYYANPEMGPEAVLNNINEQAEEWLENMEPDLHFFIGVYNDDRFYFALYGNPMIYLVYRSKQNVKLIDLKKEHAEPHNSTTLFPSLIEGSLNPGDYFFVASPNVNELVPMSTIQHNLELYGAKESIKIIRRIAKNSNEPDAYGGLFIQLPKVHQPNKPTKTSDATEDSMKALISKRKETEKTLSPSFLTSIKEKIDTFSNRKKDKNLSGNNKDLSEKEIQPLPTKRTRSRIKQTQEVPNGLLDLILVAIGKVLVTTATGIAQIFIYIIRFILSVLILLSSFVLRKPERRKQITDAWSDSWRSKQNSVSDLSIISKILLLLIIFGTIAFVISITTIRVQEEAQINQQSHLNAISLIESKKDEADASMIYGDDVRALELLKEAQQLIAELPQETAEDLQNIQRLSTIIDDGLKKLQKVNFVIAEIIADLSEVNGQALLLDFIQGDIIAYGSDNNLYRINLDTGSIETHSHESIPNLLAASTPKEDDMVLLLNENNELASFDPESTVISNQVISFPTESADITNLAIYNQRVYTLDISEQQIYRHSKTQTGYDRGTAWITGAKPDLTMATDLAIDSDLYVLTGEGNVHKFEKGSQVTFSLNQIQPLLTAPTQIWTYSDVQNLYILEPRGKRVVVFDKTGSFIQQYSAVNWQNPTGMVILEEEKLGYVLDGSLVYRFELE